ncbi:MAG: hypothetical protein M5U28_23160 [Sandaracinaceae bacterium]|nr:hypothetical protein [Sandaracinaceae bacterium]
MPTPKAKKKRGAPQKAPEGLNEVLFVRVSPDLIRRLDALVERERAERPGRAVSRADVAREILYNGTKEHDDA